MQLSNRVGFSLSDAFEGRLLLQEVRDQSYALIRNFPYCAVPAAAQDDEAGSRNEAGQNFGVLWRNRTRLYPR